MIERYFDLQLTAGRRPPLFINVNQYDHNEKWIFTLMDDKGIRYVPTSGAIVGLKSDNTVILNAGTVDNAGRVVITETEQMTAAAGFAVFEILIDNESHGSANFTLVVEPMPGGGATPSESEIDLIQQAIDAAAQIGDTSALAAQVEELTEDVAAIPEYTLDYFEGSGHRTIMLKAGETNKGNVHVAEEPTKNGNYLITSGAVFDAVNQAEQIDTTSMAAGIYLNPNIYYIYGELASLQLRINNVSDDGLVHRYFVRFRSGATATRLDLPDGCAMPTGFEIQANHTYEIEIIKSNGELFGKYTEW